MEQSIPQVKDLSERLEIFDKILNINILRILIRLEGYKKQKPRTKIESLSTILIDNDRIIKLKSPT